MKFITKGFNLGWYNKEGKMMLKYQTKIDENLNKGFNHL